MTNKEIITNDIKIPNKDMEVLRKHFSHCFDKNGDFQIEKFKQSISENKISFSKESYSMDWLGKSYARLLASDPATTLLKEDKEHNQKPENKEAENLLLKGDNLEVLKHLTNAYYEKIKMIYIDPPYNTGGDGFVYQDDRKFTVEELQDLAGMDKERAQRILDFTQSKSNSHSAWLTFMYPRLYIAKQLLREDGVIFISIDDNEVSQLKLMMDDIFGEENFVANIIPIVNPGGRDYNQIAVTNEYILIYSKSELLILNELAKDVDFKFKDSKGGYILRELRNRNPKFHSGNRPNLFYPFFVDPNNCKNGYCSVSLIKDKNHNIEVRPYNSVGKESVWRWGVAKSKRNITVNNLDLSQILARQKKDGNWNIYEKNRRDTTKAKSVWDETEMRTENGTRHFRSLFSESYFDHPKPVELIKKSLKISSNNEDIILDFFAGSGTTGDAVMQLNAEDKGNRKYILVQLPEPIDAKSSKVAYEFVTKELKAEPTIFEITRERLIRAAKKINQELNEKNKELEASIKTLETELPTEETQEEIKSLKEEIQVNKQVQAQNNFKVFETMPIWEDYHFEAKELDEQLKLFDETKLKEEDLAALLITWKTYDGITLTEELQEVDLAGYKAYYAKDKLYLMDKGFTTDGLKALLERIDSDKSFNPTSIIVFGYHFESKNLRELAENLKSYSNKKNIDIDFITRY